MVFCNFFYHIWKMGDLTYYQRNKDVILNRAKDYCENGKEWLRELTRDKYRNLSEEVKNKKENIEKADTITCLKKKNKE